MAGRCTCQRDLRADDGMVSADTYLNQKGIKSKRGQVSALHNLSNSVNNGDLTPYLSPVMLGA